MKRNGENGEDMYCRWKRRRKERELNSGKKGDGKRKDEGVDRNVKADEGKAVV